MENDVGERESNEGIRTVEVYVLETWMCESLYTFSVSPRVYCECSHSGGTVTLGTDGEDVSITGAGVHVALGDLTSLLVPYTFKSHLSNKKSQKHLREHKHIAPVFREVNSSCHHSHHTQICTQNK